MCRKNERKTHNSYDKKRQKSLRELQETITASEATYGDRSLDGKRGLSLCFWLLNLSVLWAN